MPAQDDTGESGSETLELVGGTLCLDFANTVEGREGDERRDWIRDADDLIRWGRHAGVLSAGDVDRARAVRDAGGATPALDEALAVREAIYRVFTAIVRGEAPPAADLAAVQRSHADGMHHASLIPDEATGAWSWRWDTGRSDAIDMLRWRASASAVDLLRTGRLDRLRQCPGGGAGPCNWLFIDTTRGGNRRWCSMADCGGRAKWTRQNARRRGRAS